MAESSRHLKVENDERDLSTTGTDASQNFAKTSKSSLVSSEFSDEAIAIRGLFCVIIIFPCFFLKFVVFAFFCMFFYFRF